MKTEFAEYSDTGMLGAYVPGHAVLCETADGVNTIFRDATYHMAEDRLTLEREMYINGKSYFVTSVFPVESKATPTDKLLSLIDTNLSKEAHSA